VGGKKLAAGYFRPQFQQQNRIRSKDKGNQEFWVGPCLWVLPYAVRPLQEGKGRRIFLNTPQKQKLVNLILPGNDWNLKQRCHLWSCLVALVGLVRSVLIQFIRKSPTVNKKEFFPILWYKRILPNTYKLAKMNSCHPWDCCQLGDVPAEFFLNKDQHPDFEGRFSKWLTLHLTKRLACCKCNDWWFKVEEATSPAQQAMPITGGFFNMRANFQKMVWLEFHFGQWRPLGSGGEEYKNQKKACRNGMVEAIVILTRKLCFLIPPNNSVATLGLLNNKKSPRTVTLPEETRTISRKEGEVLIFGFGPPNLGDRFGKRNSHQFSTAIFRILAKHTTIWLKFDWRFWKRSWYLLFCYPQMKLKQRFLIMPINTLSFINRECEHQFWEKIESLQVEFLGLAKTRRKVQKWIYWMFLKS